MKPDDAESDRWLTAAQVGKLIGFSADQVWKGEGALAELTPIRIGKRSVRYSEREVLEWMQRQYNKAKAEHSCQPTNNVFEFKKPKNLLRERGKQIIRQIRNRSNDA